MPQKLTVAYFEYGRVFPQPNVDDVPLVGGNPPADLAPDDVPIPSPRPLLWVGVLCCIVAGAWLCGTLWRWASPGTPACAAAWVLLCGLAIARAWRRNR